ncbi:MAG TPA: GNAT family N-acetyltransferase [Pseudolabrys sp.]|jgi:CelD/BcsL family acetyltransferase involved in cellulose biosynthesis|nr:GNAT family N-acetyltransferase [Pseudolabrys sp.]
MSQSTAFFELPHMAERSTEPASARCRAELATSIAGLEQDWCALEQSVPDAAVFQCWAWCKAWLDASASVGLAENVRIVLVRHRGRLGLLWPLAVRRTCSSHILHALAEPATQYCGALVDPEQDAGKLFTAAWTLIRSWKDIDLVELRRVRQDSPLQALPPIAANKSITFNNDAAPFIDTSLASACAHRSSRTRNALRRHRRKLEAHGPLTFEVLDAPILKLHALKEALTLKRKWLQERGKWSGGYAHPAADAFSSPLTSCREYVVARLRVGEATAAVEAGFVTHGRYWSLTQSYDSRFASHAPGRLLMDYFIDHCARTGIGTIDLLAPAHPHKRQWSTGEVAVRDHHLPLSVKGHLVAAFLRRGRPGLKNFARFLPAPARLRVLRAIKW